MPRRALLLGAAGLCAVLALAVIVFGGGNDDAAAAAPEGSTDVLVASADLAAGTLVDRIGGDVEVITVSAEGLPAGVLTDAGALDTYGGQVLVTDIDAGTPVLPSAFGTPDDLRNETAAVPVPEGMVEVSVTLEPQRVVGGRLRPGDTVAVVGSFDGETQRTKILVRQAVVTAVQTESLPESDVGDGAVEAAPTANFIVGVAVSPADLERVVYTQEWGNVYLAVDPTSTSLAPTTGQTGASVTNDLAAVAS
ncbi:MAG: RcpC/CpaB family pilus assembly protein [Actinomycetota bacterium]|nr:RcpC/CpaB family pilus assembly protein [Actinomycetota bacterium]